MESDRDDLAAIRSTLDSTIYRIPRKIRLGLVGLGAVATVWGLAQRPQSPEVDAAVSPQTMAPSVGTAVEPAHVDDKAEERRKGFHCLSAWDGSNRSLVDQIKHQLRDPDSFQHDETLIGPITSKSEGKHPIKMRYRAKNGFGGMNIGEAYGLVDPQTCEATIIANADE